MVCMVHVVGPPQIAVAISTRELKLSPISTLAPLILTEAYTPHHLVKSVTSSFVLLPLWERLLSWTMSPSPFCTVSPHCFSSGPPRWCHLQTCNGVGAEVDCTGSLVRGWERILVAEELWQRMFCSPSSLIVVYGSGSWGSGCRVGCQLLAPGVWRFGIYHTYDMTMISMPKHFILQKLLVGLFKILPKFYFCVI